MVPVWGAVLRGDLYFFSERRTAKARHVAANAHVVVHLESADNVVIVNGYLEDLGLPQEHVDVLGALEAKYSDPADAVTFRPRTLTSTCCGGCDPIARCCGGSTSTTPRRHDGVPAERRGRTAGAAVTTTGDTRQVSATGRRR